MKKIVTALLFGIGISMTHFSFAQDLVVYLKNGVIQKHDLGDKGHSVSDLVTRTGDLYFELNGPAVGKYYTRAKVTHIFSTDNFDMREYIQAINLPEGEILTMNYTKVELGQRAVKGHSHRGIILGGTGIYSGIRGSYDIAIAENEQVWKAVFHIQK